MKLPTAEEINPYKCLDGNVAEKNFLGKTLQEAEEMFRENSLRYQEDLMWMGPIGFCFYVQAAINYVKSPFADDDSDIINFLCSDIQFQLENVRDKIAPIFPNLIDFFDYVLDNWARFNITPKIYGNLKERYRALKESLIT